MGPPPFRFVPSQGPSMQGPAFSPYFKLLAAVLVLGLAAWFVRLWLGGRTPGGTVSIFTWFLAALAMVLYTAWHVVRSVTTLDAQQLRQTWVWEKKVELRELASAQLIRVRGLEWLVAPRLLTRTLSGKLGVFHAADPRMIDELARMVAELRAFRQP
nr:hypothetical protein [Caenimonas aquaedulcis]